MGFIYISDPVIFSALTAAKINESMDAAKKDGQAVLDKFQKLAESKKVSCNIYLLCFESNCIGNNMFYLWDFEQRKGNDVLLSRGWYSSNSIRCNVTSTGCSKFKVADVKSFTFT